MLSVPPDSLSPVEYLPHRGDSKPDVDAIVRLGMAGHPIEIGTTTDYFRLFHAMDRMKVFGKFQLLRKQIGASRWHAYIVSSEACREAELTAQAKRSPASSDSV